MKFSDITEAQWQELKPYLDTAIIPVTGLSGSEEPWQATQALEQLRKLLDAIEEPFHGRVVTYPAYHYISDHSIEKDLKQMSRRLHANGYTYVIIAERGHAGLQADGIHDDLILSLSDYRGMTVGHMKKDVHMKIIAMWNKAHEATNM